MDEIQQTLKKYNINPSTLNTSAFGGSSNGGGGLSEFDEMMGAEKVEAPAAQEVKQPGAVSRVAQVLGKYGARVGETAKNAVNTAADNLNIADAQMRSGGASNAVGGALRKVGRVAGGVVETLGAPLTAAITPAIERAVSNINPENKAVQAIGEFVAANPEKAKDIQNIIDISTAGIGKVAAPFLKQGLKAVGTATEKAAVAGAKTAVTAADVVTNTAKKATSLAGESIRAGRVDKKLAQTVEAIDPILKGKRTVQAYKEIVTKGRGVSGGTIRKQKIDPSARTVELAKTIQDIPVYKNEVKTLQSFRKALGKTESDIKTELNLDPTVVYTADKPTFYDGLKNIIKNAPEEVKLIKDSKTQFEGVAKYAQKLVDEAPDTLEGLRAARSKFDAQVKREFKTAFNESGSVNTSTPAGQAIKEVRDLMNNHLYDTAPNGSKIKALIGREAAILRANESVSEKAALKQATSKVGRTAKGALKTAGTVGVGAGLTAGAIRLTR